MRTTTGNDRYVLALYQTGSVVNASVETVDPGRPADPEQWTKVYEGYKEYGVRSKTGRFVYDQKRKEDIIAALSAISQKRRSFPMFCPVNRLTKPALMQSRAVLHSGSAIWKAVIHP